MSVLNYLDKTVLQYVIDTLEGKVVKSVNNKTGNVTLTKSDIGLGNVNNTADENKNVNYATSAGSADSAMTADKLTSVIANTTAIADTDKVMELSGTSTYITKTALMMWTYIKGKLGIGTGTTTFLRNDGQWATPDSGTKIDLPVSEANGGTGKTSVLTAWNDLVNSLSLVEATTYDESNKFVYYNEANKTSRRITWTYFLAYIKTKLGISSSGSTSSYLNQQGSWTTPTNTNTTYTFANGTNGFSVTPSGGTKQTVTVTPSITNNLTGSGTSGYLAKFNGTNTMTNGPALGSSTDTFLTNAGTWASISPGMVYGTCGTAAATAAKAVTITKGTWTASAGNQIAVKFTYSNTNGAPALSINGTTYTIKKYGTTAPGTSATTSWTANSVVTFTYDGTNMMMNDHIDDTNTSYVIQTRRSSFTNAQWRDLLYTYQYSTTINGNVSSGSAGETYFNSTFRVREATGVMYAGAFADLAEYSTLKAAFQALCPTKWAANTSRTDFTEEGIWAEARGVRFIVTG